MFRSGLILAVLACFEGISAQSYVGAVVPGIFIPTNVTNVNNYGRNVANAYQPQQHQPQPFIPQISSNYGWVVPSNNGSNSIGSQGQHDWVVGSRAHGDGLLFKTIITKSVGIFRSMAEKTIVFPDPKSKQRIRQITSIVVSDNTKKGTGGHSQIISGGVGRSSVEMRFKSANGKKIDLSLAVYGFE